MFSEDVINNKADCYVPVVLNEVENKVQASGNM